MQFILSLLLTLQCCCLSGAFFSASHYRMRRSVMVMRSIVPDKGLQSAWQLARRSEIRMPCVILVSPFVDGNVGSVSRCMLNWGLSELRIVDPRCDHLSETARALAVGSTELLENAKVFATLEECVRDLQRVYATTARNRDLNQRMHTPSTFSVEAIELSNIKTLQEDTIIPVDGVIEGALEGALGDGLEGEGGIEGEGKEWVHVPPAVGIVFGRERDGLTNEELALADSTISIPANENYSVLNLAQAVNIVGYELFKRQLEIKDKVEDGGKLSLRTSDRLASRGELDLFLGRLKENLLLRNYKPVSKNNGLGIPVETNKIQAKVKGGKGAKEGKGKYEKVSLSESAVAHLKDLFDVNIDESATEEFTTAAELRSENELEYYQDLKFRALQAIFRRSGVTKAEVDTLQGMLSTLIRAPGGGKQTLLLDKNQIIAKMNAEMNAEMNTGGLITEEMKIEEIR